MDFRHVRNNTQKNNIDNRHLYLIEDLFLMTSKPVFMEYICMEHNPTTSNPTTSNPTTYNSTTSNPTTSNPTTYM
jgi:hypothetical protein